MATRNAVLDAVRFNSARKEGAKALIIPQTAKQQAKDIVPRVRFRFDGDSIGMCQTFL
jgi:hypothetical protein